MLRWCNCGKPVALGSILRMCDECKAMRKEVMYEPYRPVASCGHPAVPGANRCWECHVEHLRSKPSTYYGSCTVCGAQTRSKTGLCSEHRVDNVA